MFSNFFKPVEVTEKIYQKFIDTGKVPRSIIHLLAIKIIDGRELNEMEFAIFSNKTSEINNLITEIKKD